MLWPQHSNYQMPVNLCTDSPVFVLLEMGGRPSVNLCPGFWPMAGGKKLFFAPSWLASDQNTASPLFKVAYFGVTYSGLLQCVVFFLLLQLIFS
jgi:hypothetical protein